MTTLWLMIHPGSRDERGASGVEYGLMVALIAGVIVAVVVTLGISARDAYNSMIGTF